MARRVRKGFVKKESGLFYRHCFDVSFVSSCDLQKHLRHLWGGGATQFFPVCYSSERHLGSKCGKVCENFVSASV